MRELVSEKRVRQAYKEDGRTGKETLQTLGFAQR